MCVLLIFSSTVTDIRYVPPLLLLVDFLVLVVAAALLFFLAKILGQTWILGRRVITVVISMLAFEYLVSITNSWHGLIYHTVSECIPPNALGCRSVVEGLGVIYHPLYNIFILINFLLFLYSIGMIFFSAATSSPVNRRRIIIMSGIYVLPLLPMLRDSRGFDPWFLANNLPPAQFMIVMGMLGLNALVLLGRLLDFPLAAWNNRSTHSEQATLCYSDTFELIELNRHASQVFGIQNRNQPIREFCPPLLAQPGELHWQGRDYQLQYENYQDTGTVVTLLDVTTEKAQHRQLAELNIALQAAQEQLRFDATHDALTGLANRRILDSELGRLSGVTEPVSLILGDIDDFRLINAKYGHPGGDQVLVQIAERLQRHFPKPATCCRYGGEEYCIILPGVPLSEADARAEAFLTDLNATPCRIGETEVTVTLSLAVIDNQNYQMNELLVAADQSLRIAKMGGKNRVELAQTRPIWNTGWVC